MVFLNAVVNKKWRQNEKVQAGLIDIVCILQLKNWKKNNNANISLGLRKSKDTGVLYAITALETRLDSSQISALENSWNGFPHVAGRSSEAVHQLRVGEKHHSQGSREEEPVCPQKQLHPQEERQQEEKPSLQQPESPRLLAQNVPGWAEERTVGWPQI